MIKEFIKRDGRVVPFQAEKALGWGKWGARGFSKYIDWQKIVVQTVSQMSERCTAKEFNNGLIRNALNEDSWAGQLMAGRIYAADIHKEVFGSKKKLPLKQVHEIMITAGVMVQLNYSEEEYALIDSCIDHERDFHCAHYPLKQGGEMTERGPVDAHAAIRSRRASRSAIWNGGSIAQASPVWATTPGMPQTTELSRS